MVATTFNLVVRDNLEQTQDDFGCGDVRRFATTPITCGTDGQCDCALPGPDNADAGRWFSIDRAGDGSGFLLIPEPGVPVFVNESPVAAGRPRELLSGDMIRVGHLTFRFQRIRPGVAMARRSDLLSTIAKTLLLLIFAAELGVVYWLPRQLQKSKLMAVDVMRQRTVRELDTLRADVKLGGDAQAGSIPFMTRSVVAEELDHLTLFVRNNEKKLSGRQWQEVASAIAKLTLLVRQADSGAIGEELPGLDMDAAVRQILIRNKALPSD